MLAGKWTFALLAAATAAYIGFKGTMALGRLSGGQRPSNGTEAGDTNEEEEERPPEQPEWLNPGESLSEARQELSEHTEIFRRDHSGEQELLGQIEPGAGAVTKPRSQNIEDMNLVQMVERFALALEEHRKRGADASSSSTVSAPDPALMEALRILPTISRSATPRFATDGYAAPTTTTRGQVDQTELALREALEKLQRVSGGA